MKENLRVTLGQKHMTEGRQLIPQLEVVVDLPVEYEVE
jgi:hypothetical protein